MHLPAETLAKLLRPRHAVLYTNGDNSKVRHSTDERGPPGEVSGVMKCGCLFLCIAQRKSIEHQCSHERDADHLQRGTGGCSIEVHWCEDGIQSLLCHVSDLLVGHIALEGIRLATKVGQSPANKELPQ